MDDFETVFVNSGPAAASKAQTKRDRRPGGAAKKPGGSPAQLARPQAHGGQVRAADAAAPAAPVARPAAPAAKRPAALKRAHVPADDAGAQPHAVADASVAAADADAADERRPAKQPRADGDGDGRRLQPAGPKRGGAERPYRGTSGGGGADARPAGTGYDRADGERAGDPLRAAPLPAVPSARELVAPGSVFTAANASFGGLPIEPKLAAHLEQHLRLPRPTLVQARALPPILAGRDVLVRAETGSGKTLAYLIPIVQRLIESSRARRFTREQGTLCLVLAPTRELCFQTLETFEALTRPLPWIVCGAVVGGENRKSEKARLRKGVTALVATPGRLDDHLQHTEAIRVDYVQAIVLDEADRLLDLGFGDKILAILALLDERRRDTVACQRVLVSATLPAAVLDLASAALRDPVYVRVVGGDDDGAGAALAGDGAEMEVVPAGLEKTRAPRARASTAAVAADAAADGASGDDDDDDDDGAVRSAALAARTLRERLGAEAAADAEAAGGTDRLSAPAQLRQHFVVVPAKLRLVMLSTFLNSSLRHADATGAKVLVFVSTGLQVEFYAEVLRREADARAPPPPPPLPRPHATGADADADAEPPIVLSGLTASSVYALHGSMAQSERTATWKGFVGAKAGVLIATDVAARGLNLDGVGQIVQFDLPADPMEYVHRIGRTARIGRAGAALLFVLPSETGFLELLRGRGLELSEVRYESIQAALGGVGRVGKSADDRRRIFEAEVALQHKLERLVGGDKTLHDLGGRAFQSFLCAYAAHPKATKAVLRLRDLHLGHVAKAFGLKEPPTEFSYAAQQKQALKLKAKGRSKGIVAGRRSRIESGITPSLRPGPKALTPAERFAARRASGAGGDGKIGGKSRRDEMPGAGSSRPRGYMVDRRMPG